MLHHPETGDVESKLLYEYENLWLGLLRVPGSVVEKERLLQPGGQERSQSSLKLELLDSLIKCILRVLGQLDLSYRYDLETPNTVKDFTGYKVSAK